ncbi:polysaccharide pyruvyl transferase family protein [Planococcus maritimus]|uniref:polysaccharide pyruvyl transferase family protein n=1 Tax=Planococcus maritimus TaxID=192421 RepID=UPI00079BDE30|nr:polysaccharide pyruvyl transferase family protein [Planococcus maritimus]KYG59429.1 hypothetical protein AY633_04080 [Planococcus maritimus]
MKRILLCGVPNSGNLGDRVIAESINYIFSTSHNSYEIQNFDLTNGLMRKEQKLVKIGLASSNFTKRMIPNSLRRRKVINVYKKNSSLTISIKKHISETDVVVIGGGHLLIDNYLNFPTAIDNIVKEAKIQGIPVIFAFVGAKGPWSKTAKELLTSALEYATYIVVRDRDSKEFLLSINKNLNEKLVAISDPALFVKEIIGVSSEEKVKTNIGLGIMDPNEIRRHSNLRWSRRKSALWWSELAKNLVSKGYQVSIFTNGAATDNGFVEYFIKKELKDVQEVDYCEYPTTHVMLLNSIKKQDIIIAQRLHACLPAISLGKITFGLAWDRKLENILKELDLADFLIDFNDSPTLNMNKIELQLAVKDSDKLKNENLINAKKREMLAFVNQKI